MKRDPVSLALLLCSSAALVLAPACASMRPPAQNDGPALSSEGVQLAVLQQSCTQTKETERPNSDLAEAIVEVEVRNPAPEAVTVNRTEFRLRTPDGFALKTRTWGSAEPLVLKGGETRVFEMRFMSRGSLECSRELQLDAGAGIGLGGKSIRMKPVTFVPATMAGSKGETHSAG